MRTDLHQLEQIDNYLNGAMTGEELRAFESQLAVNPDLKQALQEQQLFIQTVNRKALLAEINAIAAGGATPWYANSYLAATGSIIAVGAIATGIYFVTSDSEGGSSVNVPAENNIETLAHAEIPEKQPSTFMVDRDTMIASTPTQTSSIRQNSHNNSPSANSNFQASPNTQHTAAIVAPVTSSDVIHDQTSNNRNVHTDPAEEVSFSDRSNINRMASFPNGDIAMRDFITENMRFPGSAREKELSGNVRVSFLVTPEGNRTHIVATCFSMRDKNDKPLNATQMMLNQRIANLFEREAARIIRIMPIWEPATDSQGNPVSAEMEIHFNFSLKEGNSVYQLHE